MIPPRRPTAGTSTTVTNPCFHIQCCCRGLVHGPWYMSLRLLAAIAILLASQSCRPASECASVPSIVTTGITVDRPLAGSDYAAVEKMVCDNTLSLSNARCHTIHGLSNQCAWRSRARYLHFASDFTVPHPAYGCCHINVRQPRRHGAGSVTDD